VVYVLDENGRRLLKLSAGDGHVDELFQLPANVSAFAIATAGGAAAESEAIVLTGRDRLYFTATLPKRHT
jgi:hypothetical protein